MSGGIDETRVHTDGRGLLVIARWTGEETRALREATRMTILEFAGRLGVSDRMISKWEAGGANIRPRPVNQAALDRLLRRADHGEQTRFALLLDARGGHRRTRPDDSEMEGHSDG